MSGAGCPRVTHPFATVLTPEGAFSFDLHVLSTPPAFVLSQDQTLHEEILENSPCSEEPERSQPSVVYCQTVRLAPDRQVSTGFVKKTWPCSTTRDRSREAVMHAVQFSRIVDDRGRGRPFHPINTFAASE